MNVWALLLYVIFACFAAGFVLAIDVEREPLTPTTALGNVAIMAGLGALVWMAVNRA